VSPIKSLTKPNPSYRWYILAASFGILFFTTGTRFSFGVMFKPMIAEFGWDRGSLSLAFFLNMTIFALSLTIVGRLYDRYGPIWVIIISSFFFSAGYIAVSFINSLWQFYLCYGIIAAIGLGGTSVSLMAAITSKWFEKWRGLAISVALSGSCLGEFVLIPLFTIFAARYGWRLSYLYMGLITLGVNVNLALFVMKPDPTGIENQSSPAQPKMKSNQRESETSPGARHHDLSLGEAMQTRSFWLFLLVMFVCGSGDFLVTTHLIPCATDYGISATTAGNMLAWSAFLSLAGILIAGPASDRFGNKAPVALTFTLRFLLFWLILKYQNILSFYIFSLIFGFTLLITAPIATTLIGRLYGFSHLGLISGFITTIHHLGGGFWAYMGGLLFDKTGSYQLAFRLSAVMALVAVFSALFITEKKYQIMQNQGLE
jgi:MFS family permease